MRVTLDGQIYELRKGTGVTRTPLVEWPENTRLDGQQLRKDRRLLSSWVIDSWAAGLGREQANAATLADLASLWDVENVDTRFDGQIVLSPALNTCTIVPSRGDLNLAFAHLDDLYFVETTRDGTIQPAVTYKFSAPFTLGSEVDLVTYGSTAFVGSVSAVRAFEGRVAFIDNNSDIDRFHHFDFPPGSIGNSAAGIQVGSITNIYPQIGNFGGTVHILYYDSVAQFVTFWLGDHLLAVPSASAVATIGAIYGSYMAPLVTDGVTMFANLPQGILASFYS